MPVWIFEALKWLWQAAGSLVVGAVFATLLLAVAELIIMWGEFHGRK